MTHSDALFTKVHHQAQACLCHAVSRQALRLAIVQALKAIPISLYKQSYLGWCKPCGEASLRWPAFLASMGVEPLGRLAFASCAEGVPGALTAGATAGADAFASAPGAFCALFSAGINLRLAPAPAGTRDAPNTVPCRMIWKGSACLADLRRVFQTQCKADMPPHTILRCFEVLVMLIEMHLPSIPAMLCVQAVDSCMIQVLGPFWAIMSSALHSQAVAGHTTL